MSWLVTTNETLTRLEATDWLAEYVRDEQVYVVYQTLLYSLMEQSTQRGKNDMAARCWSILRKMHIALVAFARLT